MKKNILLILILLLISCKSDDNHNKSKNLILNDNLQKLQSPNKNLDLSFHLDLNGRPIYSLNFENKAVVLESGLGFIIKDNVEWMKIDTLDMMNNFKILDVKFDT